MSEHEGTRGMSAIEIRGAWATEEEILCAVRSKLASYGLHCGSGRCEPRGAADMCNPFMVREKQADTWEYRILVHEVDSDEEHNIQIVRERLGHRAEKRDGKWLGSRLGLSLGLFIWLSGILAKAFWGGLIFGFLAGFIVYRCVHLVSGAMAEDRKQTERDIDHKVARALSEVAREMEAAPG